MEQSLQGFEHLKSSLIKWQRTPSHQWKEGELARLLDSFQQFYDEEDKEVKQLTGELKAMVAAARFLRKKEWDTRVDQELIEAFEQSPSSTFVSELFIHLVLDLMNEPWFDEELPKIRETDHSQGKRKSIDHLLMLLHKSKAWHQQLSTKQDRMKQALENQVSDQDVENAALSLKLLNQIGNSIDAVIASAEGYRETISGIYSSKDKKSQMTEKIKELQQQIEKWEEWRQSLGESESHALDELTSMVGIEEVKNKVKTYYYYLEYQRERQRQGYHFANERNLNMILTGNPGTGKTTIARLLAKIYHQLGALPRENVVEVDRSHLVGAYVGQTEEKTMNVIQEAVGGILFIDEAYSLKREGASGTDYGQTAIDTIVSAMTSGEYAGQFAVILAGYPDEMRTFLWSNPGLRSRFPETNHIHLPDFSMEELVEIAEHVALDNDYSLTESALKQLRKQIDKEKVDENFGNARTVKNLVLDAIFQQGSKAAQEKDYSKDTFTILDEEAFLMDDRAETDESQSGENKLHQLIGLDNVKEEVRKLASFVKIQKEREAKGLPIVPVQLHAVFSGPPGTGKTTVAHIYSQILHELDLLKRGHVVIAGRSDLVAGYVGQTAIKTKKIIREALGGVLFIDEAYSLIHQGEQDFGREAIDTLVEEMTKHEENLVVILAGYSSPMSALLNSNPGLASRFKKSISFADYKGLELVEILEYYIESFGYELEDQARTLLKEKLSQDPPEGNARAMKDLVEDAIQNQAYRLIYDENHRGALSSLTSKDFSIINEEERN